ncbi:MAG: bifunctional nuclease family protein [Candidatus Omnitrophica bacterium]|nr:bifunctional nuclease family protein [Candidatus Omnitrophota bacterium]MDD5352900.1 bifunctional nuclease family protein [Candidatus Omnitrophota bacterium]MDD5550499.1 bifunctional nuclease family protein [Candidatus Omnitrophota bacterium]
MVEMELNKIIIDEKRQEQVIVLKEKNGQRILPIIIGLLEAMAIKMEVGGVNPPRPLTHDLLKNLIDNLGAKLEKVIVDKILDNTFHAKLVINTGDSQVKYIDARPSDSIALAVRTKSPIFVEEEVLNNSEIFNPPEK